MRWTGRMCPSLSIPGLTSSCRELNAFPPGAHWFCPRRGSDDAVNYDEPDEDEEDMDAATKHKMIKEAKVRHRVAYRYSLIIGLAPEVAGSLLSSYIERLDAALSSCDKCTEAWHKGRKSYLKELRE